MPPCPVRYSQLCHQFCLLDTKRRRLCMDSYHQPIRILYKIEKKVAPTHDTSNTLISYGATDIRGQGNRCCFLSTAASNQQTLVSGLRNAIGKKIDDSISTPTLIRIKGDFSMIQCLVPQPSPNAECSRQRKGLSIQRVQEAYSTGLEEPIGIQV